LGKKKKLGPGKPSQEFLHLWGTQKYRKIREGKKSPGGEDMDVSERNGKFGRAQREERKVEKKQPPYPSYWDRRE